MRAKMSFGLLVMALVMVGFIAGCSNSTEPITNTVDRWYEYPAHPGLGSASKPIIISHRGASGYLPEHTLAAYELAIQMGADYIEPDLQFTSDGYLIAMHDDTLNRTTDVETKFPGRPDWNVSSFTLAEIKTLEPKLAGTARLFYPTYTPSMPDPFRVVTFDEVLIFAKEQSVIHGREIGVYPEAKQADPDMEDKILAALADHGMDKPDSPVFIQSFSSETIASMHAKQQARGTRVPHLLLGAAVMEGMTARMGVMAGGMSLLSLSEVKEIAAGVGVVIGADDMGYPITREWIDQVHAAGLKVHGWTFDKVDVVEAQTEFRRYLDIGMDGVFTNYPDLAVLARDQFNTSYQFAPDAYSRDVPLIISHRGASGYLPEHTLPAYELAIRMGADYVEQDVMTSSDNVLIVQHDSTLNNCTDIEDHFSSPYRLSSFSLEQIKTLKSESRGGSGYTPKTNYSYPGYTPSMPNPWNVLTLEEALDWVLPQQTKYGRTIGVYPELKADGYGDADQIYDMFESRGLNTPGAEAIVQSFYPNMILYYHNLVENGKGQGQGKQRKLVLLGSPRLTESKASIYMSGNLDTDTVSRVGANDVLPTFTPGRDIPLAGIGEQFANGLGPSITNSGALGYITYGNDHGSKADAIEWVRQAHAAGFNIHPYTFSLQNAIAAADQYYRGMEVGIDGFFSNYPNICKLMRDRYLKYGPSEVPWE